MGEYGGRPHYAFFHTGFRRGVRCEDPVTEVSELVNQLVKLSEDLYDAGARNFLFIDVPPIHRSPAGMTHRLFNTNDC